MAEVLVLPEFHEWYASLDERDSDAVMAAVDVLEARGVTLGAPRSSSLKACKYALRELRVQSGGEPLRIAYGFDPKRQAVILLGANKTGDDRFYEWFIPHAEKLWERYLREIDE